MVFEIFNDYIENFILSYFISTYIDMKKFKTVFIFLTSLLNTFISIVLTYIGLIGISQTLLVQILIIFFLHICNKNFSFQDVIISFLGNILLFIGVYFSVYILSFIYNINPSEIYVIKKTYYTHVILSKCIFIILVYLFLKFKPLKILKKPIIDQNYLLLFEFLIILIMSYYFVYNALKQTIKATFFSSFGFIGIFLIFCYLSNKIILMNQQLFETQLKNKQNYYKYENLKNLKSIQNHIENTEHRINYILQSLEYDLYNKNYSEAIKKINISKELVHKISPVICTDNELFDFLLNMEIKRYLKEQKKIKLCTFISKNCVYDNYEIINFILDTLQIIYNKTDKVELFITENENHILQIKYILNSVPYLTEQSFYNEIIKKTSIVPHITKIDMLILITMDVNLNDYM